MAKKKKTALTRRQSQVLADVDKLHKAHKKLALDLEKVKKRLMSPLGVGN